MGLAMWKRQPKLCVIVNTVQVKMSGSIIFSGMSNISNAGYNYWQIELNLIYIQ